MKREKRYTPEALEPVAKALQEADAEWREDRGYTGSPVHRHDYWRHMAAFFLDLMTGNEQAGSGGLPPRAEPGKPPAP